MAHIIKKHVDDVASDNQSSSVRTEGIFVVSNGGNELHDTTDDHANHQDSAPSKTSNKERRRENSDNAHGGNNA